MNPTTTELQDTNEIIQKTQTYVAQRISRDISQEQDVAVISINPKYIVY